MDWIIAISGTFLSYLYVSEGTKPLTTTLVPIAYSITFLALFLSTIAVLNLGRSFGIVPANRGIKTNGFYKIVRHPIYSFYIAHDLGWILLCSSVANTSVFLLFCVVTYFRAEREERILREDPDYAAYALTTRYMFFPGIA
jgi:protein-S-isoprenylcysteine O-methyltransferase Ste14